MKTYFLSGLCALIFTANSASAQDTLRGPLPTAVNDSFKRSFPDAAAVEWWMDGSHYKVKFETGSVQSHHKVWYSNSGEWIRHEEKILKGDLPPRVLDSMYAHFSGYRLDDEIERITERHRVTYVLELTKDADEWKVIYDSQGTLVSKRED